MRSVAVLYVLVIWLAPAMAQHPHEPGAAKALELYPGLGNYHFSISTKNREAQIYFD